jgi:hypothetical protein
MLSKFAHPTAMMIFSFPDEPKRGQACGFFLGLGSVLCMASMMTFEDYAKEVCQAPPPTK